MTSRLYGGADYAVRDDLAAVHRWVIDQWAQPGTWWTGEERLAIVAEVRRARAAEPLPPWTKPSTIDGLVATDDQLGADVVDIVWRLTNHPGTLTDSWYHEDVSFALPPGRYVELVVLVGTATTIDSFAEALGLDHPVLPAPVPGEPTEITPPGAAVTTHWVPTGPVRGGNVMKATSLVPEQTELWRRLSDAQYVPADALLDDLAYSRGPLTRMQIELLAARTSRLNDCFY